MSPIKVEDFLGISVDQIDRSDGYINYYYENTSNPVLGFQDGKLIDITFGRYTEALYFDGLDYFTTPGAVFLDRIRQHDPGVKRDILGTVTSFLLGIAFDDRVPLGESDKTITSFAKEQIKEYGQFGPFKAA